MTPRERVYIYYEDSRTTAGDFRLHDLILACVADKLQVERRELRHIVGDNPRKSNAKVIAACIRDAPHLRHAHIVAFLDGDRLGDVLSGIRPGFCKREANEAFRKKVEDTRIELCVLDRNVETLIDALERLGLSSSAFADARKKDRDARDRVFASAAAADSKVRTALVDDVTSFGRLIRKLVVWCRSQDES